MATGVSPPDGYEEWTEFHRGLVPDLVRLLWHTVPATAEVRDKLALKAAQAFAKRAEKRCLMEYFIALTVTERCIPLTEEEADRFRRLRGELRERMKVALYRIAYDTGRRFVEGLRSLRRVPAAEFLGRALPSDRWKGLAQETKVTLSYWLVNNFDYRTAVCLAYELGEPPSLVRRVLRKRTRQATAKLLERAGKRFGDRYEQLKGLASPPLPAALLEAATGEAKLALTADEKQRCVISELKWLGAQLPRRLSPRGGN